MTAPGRLTPRDELEPLSVRGRAAGITMGASMVLAGVWFMWSSWASLTCPLGGARGRAVCSRAVGVGGLLFMFGLALFIAGAAVLWRTGRRPVVSDGLSGWTWGEGIAIVVGGLTIALLIPTYHCPAGYVLTPVFHVCHSVTQIPEIIVHPPTWLAWKFGIAAASIIVGVVVARWRPLPWPIASVLTIAVVGSAAWYLAETTVGLPSIG
jgi:hypothetical protein